VAGGADEWFAFQVFVIARLFADKNKFCVWASPRRTLFAWRVSIDRTLGIFSPLLLILPAMH
jgi:hypothetical protein